MKIKVTLIFLFLGFAGLFFFYLKGHGDVSGDKSSADNPIDSTNGRKNTSEETGKELGGRGDTKGKVAWGTTRPASSGANYATDLKFLSLQDEVDLGGINKKLEKESLHGAEIEELNKLVNYGPHDQVSAAIAGGILNEMEGDRENLSNLRVGKPVCSADACRLMAIGGQSTDEVNANWQQAIGQLVNSPFWKSNFDDLITTTSVHNGQMVYFSYFVKKKVDTP